jgi:hypothetical protein
MQVKITAMSQRCRKFAGPHVRQYTGSQKASHTSAVQRSQTGIWFPGVGEIDIRGSVLRAWYQTAGANPIR